MHKHVCAVGHTAVHANTHMQGDAHKWKDKVKVRMLVLYPIAALTLK